MSQITYQIILKLRLKSLCSWFYSYIAIKFGKRALTLAKVWKKMNKERLLHFYIISSTIYKPIGHFFIHSWTDISTFWISVSLKQTLHSTWNYSSKYVLSFYSFLQAGRLHQELLLQYNSLSCTLSFPHQSIGCTLLPLLIQLWTFPAIM